MHVSQLFAANVAMITIYGNLLYYFEFAAWSANEQAAFQVLGGGGDQLCPFLAKNTLAWCIVVFNVNVFFCLFVCFVFFLSLVINVCIPSYASL